MSRLRSFKTLLLAGLSVSALSACSGGAQTEAKTLVPRPPVENMDADGQALAASDTITPVMEQAPAGETVDERMARLEREVSELQADYKRIMPAFASLNTTNERIQTLLSEIEQQTPLGAASENAQAPSNTAAIAMAEPAVVSSGPAATSVLTPGAVSKSSSAQTATSAVYPEEDFAAAAKEEPAAPPLSAFANQPTVEEARAEAARQTGTAQDVANVSPAAALSAPNAIKGLRIGEHSAKTRLVFDMTGKEKPAVTYDIDNSEHLMLVQLPSSSWDAAKAGSPSSPLIENWAAQDTPSGGTAVAIQLKKNAKIVSSEYLKAEGKNPARLVVDIAAGG